MIAASDIRGYVVNLPRRTDRRVAMTHSLPSDLAVTFTSDWSGPFDGRTLTRDVLDAAGYRLFPWPIESDNPWWSRPLKYGEIGCTLAHLACWRHAAAHGEEPFVLILEDDALLGATFLDDLLQGLQRLIEFSRFDLLYLGRYLLDPDQPALPGFVSPGYSHCTFGYLLSRPALASLLGAQLDRDIVPVDEFLPSLYIDHLRPDLRARFPRQLTAFAFDPPLVHQRGKDEAGSDTEDSRFVEPRPR